ncbi:MAG: hypothetical protein JNL11_03070, partial [Bdellovibrionaceae bacterium]|nr:hypothetical protein [Pseudobdellovibrionaceae bacterium]
PTLHTEIINTLLRAHPALENTEIFITSNGWYSISDRLISDTLNKILKIDHLQLSFDVYHGSKIGMDDIKRLRNFLKEKGVKFNISICISSPADLAGANSLQNEIGELVIFQKVDSTGRARENKLEFKYPKFEKEVLNKKCPNIGQITFVANRGFSVCCSNLAFNSQSNEIFHRSIEDHLSSEFYKQIERKTFGEILLIDGDVEISNFSSEFSSPCRMCEFVHKRK